MAAIAGGSYLRSPQETIPTQVIDLSSLADTAKTDAQIAKLSEQLGQLSSILVAQQESKEADTEGLRGSLRAAEEVNRELAGKLDQVVEGFRGVREVTTKQAEEFKAVVNSVGARVKKLEGNAENFDTLLARVQALEDEVKVLKTRSIVEPKADKSASKETTPNGSTTVEKVVSGVVQAQPVQQTVYSPAIYSPAVYSGGSSGTVYSYQQTYQQPYQQVYQQAYQPQVVYESNPAYQSYLSRFNSRAASRASTCTQVWDRRTRSWVQVCN